MVDGQFRLSWTDGGGTVTGFQYQYRVPGGSWSSWLSAKLNTFIDLSNLVNGTTYQFQVRARNGTVASATSDTFEVRVPTVPGAPTITRVDSGNGQVNINWTAPSNDGVLTLLNTNINIVRAMVAVGKVGLRLEMESPSQVKILRG